MFNLETHLSTLLKFALGVDWLNDRLGKLATWTVLLAALISAGNAFAAQDKASRSALIVGVGLFYKTGYFRQSLNADGWQVEHYTPDVLYIEHAAGTMRGRDPVAPDAARALWDAARDRVCAWAAFACPTDAAAEASAEDQATLGHLLLVAGQLSRQLGLAKGFRVVINNGPDGGETVPHLHVHLLGGRALDWPPG